jgi:hypothetical protein
MIFLPRIAMPRCAARIVAALAVVATVILAGGCGSGSHPNIAVPPPSGSFGVSNLNGAYVFSSTGVDSSGIFLAVTGTLQANGSGGISGGMIDVNGLDFAPSSTPITSGSYSVTVDGRGRAKLNSNTSLGSSVTIDFVLTSSPSGVSSHGLVTEFDQFATGSGSLDLQSNGSLQPSYGFEFSGVTVSGNTELPFGVAGAFTVNGGGNISSGVADINNNGIATGGMNGFALSGSVAAGSPGNASLITNAGTLNFHVYMVDSTHLKFIETDSLPIVAGDAFTQQASIPASALTFTMSGSDVSQLPLVMAGFMTSDGASAISAGFQDYNDAGTVASVTPFTGSYTAIAGGRTVLTLNSIYNGDNGVLSPTVKFAAYPTSGGIQLLEVDSAGITGGIAFAQTGTSFPSSQGYGLNLAAINAGNGTGSFEEDDIGEFTLSGSTFKGLDDINDEGSLTIGTTFSGTLTPDPAVAGHGSGVSTSNQFNFNYYVVNSSTVLILETDSNQLGLGTFQLQGATQGQAPSLVPSSTLRSKSGTKVAWSRSNK